MFDVGHVAPSGRGGVLGGAAVFASVDVGGVPVPPVMLRMGLLIRVVMLGRFMEKGCSGKRRPSSILPLPAPKPRLDLLEQPGVTIRIAERGISVEGASLRIAARNRPPSRWNTSLTSTPRPMRSSRAASMSDPTAGADWSQARL